LVMDDKSNALVMQRMLSRLCGDNDPVNLSNCGRDVEQERMGVARELRRKTSESVSGLAILLKNLADVEGSKSLIVMSQGLMLEGAAARATVLAKMCAVAA